VTSNGQRSRRLDVVARRLHDPEKELTPADVSQAIAQLEADPQRSHLLGVPRERLMTQVEREIARLEAELAER